MLKQEKVYGILGILFLLQLTNGLLWIEDIICGGDEGPIESIANAKLYSDYCRGITNITIFNDGKDDFNGAAIRIVESSIGATLSEDNLKKFLNGPNVVKRNIQKAELPDADQTAQVDFGKMNFLKPQALCGLKSLIFVISDLKQKIHSQSSIPLNHTCDLTGVELQINVNADPDAYIELEPGQNVTVKGGKIDIEIVNKGTKPLPQMTAMSAPTPIFSIGDSGDFIIEGSESIFLNKAGDISESLDAGKSIKVNLESLTVPQNLPSCNQMPNFDIMIKLGMTSVPVRAIRQCDMETGGARVSCQVYPHPSANERSALLVSNVDGMSFAYEYKRGAFSPLNPERLNRTKEMFMKAKLRMGQMKKMNLCDGIGESLSEEKDSDESILSQRLKMSEVISNQLAKIQVKNPEAKKFHDMVMARQKMETQMFKEAVKNDELANILTANSISKMKEIRPVLRRKQEDMARALFKNEISSSFSRPFMTRPVMPTTVRDYMKQFSNGQNAYYYDDYSGDDYYYYGDEYYSGEDYSGESDESDEYDSVENYNDNSGESSGKKRQFLHHSKPLPHKLAKQALKSSTAHKHLKANHGRPAALKETPSKITTSAMKSEKPTVPISSQATKDLGIMARNLTCDEGKRIPRKWICDGYQDCNDNKDETNCPERFMRDEKIVSLNEYPKFRTSAQIRVRNIEDTLLENIGKALTQIAPERKKDIEKLMKVDVKGAKNSTAKEMRDKFLDLFDEKDLDLKKFRNITKELGSQGNSIERDIFTNIGDRFEQAINSNRTKGADFGDIFANIIQSRGNISLDLDKRESIRNYLLNMRGREMMMMREQMIRMRQNQARGRQILNNIRSASKAPGNDFERKFLMESIVSKPEDMNSFSSMSPGLRKSVGEFMKLKRKVNIMELYMPWEIAMGKMNFNYSIFEDAPEIIEMIEPFDNDDIKSFFLPGIIPGVLPEIITDILLIIRSDIDAAETVLEFIKDQLSEQVIQVLKNETNAEDLNAQVELVKQYLKIEIDNLNDTDKILSQMQLSNEESDESEDGLPGEKPSSDDFCFRAALSEVAAGDGSLKKSLRGNNKEKPLVSNFGQMKKVAKQKSFYFKQFDNGVYMGSYNPRFKQWLWNKIAVCDCGSQTRGGSNFGDGFGGGDGFSDFGGLGSMGGFNDIRGQGGMGGINSFASGVQGDLGGFGGLGAMGGLGSQGMRGMGGSGFRDISNAGVRDQGGMGSSGGMGGLGGIANGGGMRGSRGMGGLGGLHGLGNGRSNNVNRGVDGFVGGGMGGTGGFGGLEGLGRVEGGMGGFAGMRNIRGNRGNRGIGGFGGGGVGGFGGLGGFGGADSGMGGIGGMKENWDMGGAGGFGGLGGLGGVDGGMGGFSGLDFMGDFDGINELDDIAGSIDFGGFDGIDDFVDSDEIGGMGGFGGVSVSDVLDSYGGIGGMGDNDGGGIKGSIGGGMGGSGLDQVTITSLENLFGDNAGGSLKSGIDSGLSDQNVENLLRKFGGNDQFQNLLNGQMGSSSDMANKFSGLMGGSTSNTYQNMMNMRQKMATMGMKRNNRNLHAINREHNGPRKRRDVK